MIETLKIMNIVISILLILIILVQQKKSSLNLTTFGSDSVKTERRGPEKTIHNATVGLGAIYIAINLAYFFAV